MDERRMGGTSRLTLTYALIDRSPRRSPKPAIAAAMAPLGASLSHAIEYCPRTDFNAELQVGV